ncbi:MAG: signal peptidase I [Oscillospiraceae bacterium]|nr:signal peptidase I [Oscillospiraceae bacterium]
MKKTVKTKPEILAEGEQNTKASKSSELFDWMQCIVFALIFCILVFLFLGRTVGVIGGSMENTLFEGERLVISKLFYTPEYGDIVVLRQDTFRNEPIVKRVIATEGQTVDIDFEECVVYVDGVALDEPYTKEYGNYTYYDAQDFEDEVTVPEGCVFVMGDNRNGSTDSRTDSIGFVDTRKILGKVIFRIAPLDRMGFVE